MKKLFLKSTRRRLVSPATIILVFLLEIMTGVAQQMRQSEARVWEEAGDVSIPANRAAVVEKLQLNNQTRKATAVRRARIAGIPLRETRADGGTRELMAWEDEKPLYYTTLNVNAAISTGANLVRQVPYGVDGAGWTIGVWDGDAVRTTHHEFGARVTIKDGTTTLGDHATHVAGTIGASGVDSSAKGMATAVSIDSYDWNNDDAEMASRGASYAGESGKIYVSNHSYGYISGWYYTGYASPKWTWYGSGETTAGVENDFGMYNSYAREIDARLYNLPYYSIFWAAGNDRTDNPAAGSNVALSEGGAVVTYNPASHPPGDGNYKNGYDTIGFNGLGKNVITIGSVSDAVTSGLRDVSKATIQGYSCWGPTDDGRIKPDLVANGYNLYSTTAASDTSYGWKAGTSMATPNAAGTAQLILSLYTTLLPGHYLRASTLKGLLIHTADDLGTAGPDYKFGWGLINAKEAADLVYSVATNITVPRLIEQQVTSSITSRAHSFAWDGVSPIRATLCWTDPAGSATASSDSRTARLINNLNLRLVAPNGTQYFPFVMPFVGTWTTASMASAATTGTNNTDNVEQVLVASPSELGTWQAIVSFSGALANSPQRYSLLISGSGYFAPAPISVTPDFAVEGTVALAITGTGFRDGATVELVRAGSLAIQASVTHVAWTNMICSLDVTSMEQGEWSVRVINSDDQVGELTNAFAIVRTFANQPFEPIPSGWFASANIGSSYWAVTSAASHTPSNSYTTSGPATRNTDNLLSPKIVIPTSADRIRVHFWHKYMTEAYDGCLLEVSPDNGTTWYQVGELGSGTSFVKGGYTSTILGRSGSALNHAELVGWPAWTGNSGGNFSEVVIALNTATYAGATLRVRWRLSTDASTMSQGWWVDSFGVYGFNPFVGTFLLLF